MASTADIIGVYIAVDITAAAIMAITVRMATTAMPTVPMDIMVIGDTATMAAIGPIAGTGRGVHIVVGAAKSIIRTGTEL